MVVNGHAQGRSLPRVNGKVVSSLGAALLASLIEEWNFENGQAVTYTGSKAGKVLTDQSASSGTDNPGVIGQSVTIPDGERLQLTDDAFNFNTSPMTFALWYRRDAPIGGTNFIVNFNSTGPDASFAIRDFFGGDCVAVQVNLADTGLEIRDVDYAIPDATWTFIVVRFTGTQLILNVNARPAITAACTTLGDAPGGTLYCGYEPGNGYSEGQFQLDILQPLNRAITDAEVSYLYNSGAGRRLTS